LQSTNRYRLPQSERHLSPAMNIAAQSDIAQPAIDLIMAA
jgi:hypothetical protein